MKRSTLVNSILESILELQRNNRNITEQELATNIILILLSQKKELNLSQICEYLNCPQAYLTHLIKRLIGKKLLAVRQDKNDLRYRYFSLSQRGASLVTDLDLRYDSVLNKLESNLSKGEITCLAEMIKKMCDAGGIPEQQRRHGEHVIRPQQRRIAALIGVTGRSLFNEKISSTALHILRLVGQYGSILTFKNISDELSLKSTQVSSLLKEFNRDKLLNFIESPFDSRSKFVQLTKAGRARLSLYSEMLHSRLDEFLKDFADQELITFSKLLTSFTRRDICVTEVKDSEKERCRPDLIKQSFDNGTLKELPERICGTKDRLFTLSVMGEVKSYLQARSEDSEINIITWATHSSLIFPSLLLKTVLCDHKLEVDSSTSSTIRLLLGN